MIILYCLLIVLLTTEITTKPAQDDNIEKCGYDSCHPVKPGMLNVHLVPHTHDDVGWLKTVDQYYFGSKSNIQKAGVQYILDSVVQELMKDPNKRFIYVETSYLWKWWKKQHDMLRHQVKKLVNRGQLEFIGGGWTMNDEAVTHYQSIIDQFTWGLRKLNETFGPCGRPKIGWQIDPFGHSREMASIFAQLGYDGVFFGRLDYQDKRERMTTKTAEMIWQGSASLGNSSEIFTSVLYNNYGPPPGFCFDVLCDDEPIIDDKKSPEYNVDMKVAGFLYFAKQQAKYYSTNNIIFTMGGDFTFMDAHMWYSNLDKLIRNYQTNNVIVTMGEDFNYQDAKMWFSNLDKLIRHANALQSNGSNINLLYSTPSCYLKAVHDEGKSKKWPVKTDDFFPYASDPNAYWTGYFTSRPTIKRFERIGNNYLQICKQLYSLTDLDPEDWVDLNVLREAMGVLQHHDAITGTEKEHVTHDYARILTKGFEECDIITNTALNKIITSRTNNAPKLELNNCMLLNISQCDVSETSENFVITVYNPLSRPVSSYVRVPVTGQSYSVTDPSGTDLTIQLSPIPESLLNIPGRSSKATADLIFHASDLPPLGFKSYFIKESHLYDMTLPESEDLNIKDGDTEIRFDENTGLLSHIKLNGIDVKLSQNFLWYQSAVGNNEEYLNRSSGAYIFRPNGTRVTPVSDGTKTKSFNGPLIAEIHQVFNEWVSQVIRYYKQDCYVEFEWLVGPIPIEDKLGKEIITRYTTKLNSNGIFYTDSNGREMLKRVRNYRPTWKVLLNETIAGNYYPVTSKILIRDPVQDVEVAVMTDRAQGGSSLADGNIELMVHRRILHDDAFGVGEALNEKAYGKGLVARGQHYVIFGPYKNTTKSSIAAKEKDIAQRKLLSAWTFITPIENLSYQQYKAQYKMQYSGLKRALPKNIQILTLEPWHASTFLLRLEHVLEKNEDPELSKPVDVDIRNLFTPFTIKSAKETKLGGNQWVSDHQKMNWKTGETLENLMNHEDYLEQTRRFRYNPINTNEIPNDQPYEEIDNVILKELEQLNDFLFTLKPMEIRTFVIEIDKM